MMEHSLWMALWGILLGFAVGNLTGLLGAGGGFILTPVLNIALGVPMNVAVGTSACQVLGASGLGLYHHMDRRWLGARVALWMGGGLPLGVWFGSRVVQHLKALGILTVGGKAVPAVDFILLVVFAVFLGLVTVWLFLDSFVLSRGREDGNTHPRGMLAGVRFPPMIHFRTVPGHPFSGPVLMLMGLGVGCLSGLLGIGGGVVMVPMLFYLVGQDIKAATRTSLMLVFMAGLCATIAHALAGNVDWLLTGCLMVGAVFGTRLGTWIHHRTSGRHLRVYFAFTVLAATLMVIGKLIMLRAS